MPVENLNKENFWNALREKYPEAVDHFCKWIDDYKKEVSWDKLFREGVKFHDVPYEIQNGIITRFELEKFNNAEGKGKDIYVNIANSYKGTVTDLFADLQSQIKKRQKKMN